MKVTVALFALGLAAVSSDASSKCWVVGELAGTSITPRESAASKDAFTGRQFTVVVSGKRASVSGTDMQCVAAGTSMAVCNAVDGSRATVEAWAVDEESGRVIHVGARANSGPYSGGRFFVGRVVSTCTE